MNAARYRAGVRTLVLCTGLFFCACGDNDSQIVAPAPRSTPDPIGQLPTDATIALPGLGAATDVVFDERSMPHVFAPDTESAAFTQGYLTASVRFWEMDVFRRLAEGRLSEIFGKTTLSTDVGMRTVFTTRDGRRLEEALWQYTQSVDPELSRVLAAYAAGVNAWLADLQANRNDATLPPEYTFLIINLTADKLAPWRPQDSLAIGRLQAWELSETMEEEIGRSQAVAALPDALFKDTFRSAPAEPATVLPPINTSATPSDTSVRREVAAAARLAAGLPHNVSEIVAALAELRRMSPFGSHAEGAGSNNWIVSPALSASGHAMLANDPHLALFNPPIWHMIQLDVGPGDGNPMRITGVIFPGLPGVILGNNDFGAWGGTVSGFDVTDVYLETVSTPPDYPTSPRTVLFKGQQVPVLRIEETFHVKGSITVTEPIEVVPHHGPMVPDPDIHDNVVGLAATGMSFRWTGHEITNDARFLLNLGRARNVTDFRHAMESFAVGGQNWVWADINGDIAYFPHVLVPQRPTGTVPYLPLSGTGDAEWLTDGQGNTLWLPDAQIPQATNPPEGFLSSANNDQIGTTLDNDPLNDPVYFAFTFDLGFREQRIHELLSNAANVRPPGAKLTLADMSAYQYDHSSKEAAELLPFLFAAAQARPDLVTPEMQDALNRLQAWGQVPAGAPPYDAVSGIDAHDLRNDVAARSAPVSDQERTKAIATSIFAAWETRLGPAVFDDDFAGTGIGSPDGQDADKALLHLLKDVDRSDPGFRVYTKGPDGQSTLWDNKNTPQIETRDEILLGALGDGLTFLAGKFQSPQPENWLWGVMHQVRFQHFFGQAGIQSFDLGPFAAPGARFTVSPADYNLHTDDFTFMDGPSERYVAVLDPAGIRAVNALPGGQNGDPGSLTAYNQINPAIHYGDQISGWINGQTFDYHISRADVAAHAVRKVHYSP
ncbi:MAG: penicillin acylase family protein [Candidatus Binatia bacterium]